MIYASGAKVGKQVLALTGAAAGPTLASTREPGEWRFG
jgi:hypothetical protein